MSHAGRCAFFCPGRPAPEPSNTGDVAGCGRNRIHLVVDNFDAERERLRRAGVVFRSDVVPGPGGRQLLLSDLSGNLVELFTPAILG